MIEDMAAVYLEYGAKEILAKIDPEGMNTLGGVVRRALLGLLVEYLPTTVGTGGDVESEKSNVWSPEFERIT